MLNMWKGTLKLGAYASDLYNLAMILLIYWYIVDETV